jgi:hypothetical protein
MVAKLNVIKAKHRKHHRTGGYCQLEEFVGGFTPGQAANLLICGPGVGRAWLKIADIYLNLTMPSQELNQGARPASGADNSEHLEHTGTAATSPRDSAPR